MAGFNLLTFRGLGPNIMSHFGQDCGWYQTLEALLEDWAILA